MSQWYLPRSFNVWPKVHPFRAAFRHFRADFPELLGVIEQDEIFGVSFTSVIYPTGATKDGGEVSVWHRTSEGSVGPTSATEDRSEAGPLASKIRIGNSFSIRQTAKVSRHPLPGGALARPYGIEVLRTRNAFISTTTELFDVMNAGPEDFQASTFAYHWCKQAEQEARFTPSQHLAAASDGEKVHIGSSLITIMVEALPASNHARLEWEAAIRADVRAILAYRSQALRCRLELHPDWNLSQLEQVYTA